MIYETAREIAVKILSRIESTDSYLDKLLDMELRESKLSQIDRSFLTELVNGTIRWKLKIDYVISQFYRGDYTKLDINIKNALRLAMYQILFLERVPHSAAVNESVEFVKKLKGQYLANLSNAILRTSIRKLNLVEYPPIEDDPVKALSIIHSFPAWLVRRFINRFGVYETEQLLVSLNDRPHLSLRVNLNRTSPEKLIEKFRNAELKAEKGKYLPEFIYVEGLSRIGELEDFKEGFFTVQDESAGIVSRLLDPHPGERILDLCAAPGGKSSHIWELTNGNVDLVAVEKYENRSRLLVSSLMRVGNPNPNVVTADASTFKSDRQFDRILIDAPCTGFGVIRKKPDSKWKREPEDITKLNIIQTAILENAAGLLKSNGILVYSTCTMETMENQDVINAFLSRHPEFTLEKADQFIDKSLVSKDGFVETFPHRHDLDGSFAARM
ncbi:MAG: 16S rRNA (cytosine(967)-C(5))-methyltransferase RsmB, partial [Candidatus Kryptoniota bacterium]